MIGRAQPELTTNKRQKADPGLVCKCGCASNQNNAHSLLYRPHQIVIRLNEIVNIKSSAVIARSNITWFCKWYDNDWGKICIGGYVHKRHPAVIFTKKNSRVSYGVSFVRTWVKIDRIVTAPHCLSLVWYDSWILYNCLSISVHVVQIRSQSRKNDKRNSISLALVWCR